MIEIKHRWNGTVLYTAENAQDVRQALKEALAVGANLRDANLRDADLLGANLRDANLRDADLLGANLRGANLRGANLRGANLRGANLLGADLLGANLRGANLRGANLRGANLLGADLLGANLRGANLRGANLRGANLLGANLRGANLRGADLLGANLRDADLRGGGAANWTHPLWPTRQDFFSILDQAPGEVAAVREAMVEGKIKGSVYTEDGCGCLTGTIAIKRGCDIGDLAEQTGIVPNGSRPAEQWFIVIEKGDKPIPVTGEVDWSEQAESVFRLSWALVWLDEWVESRTAIAKALAA